MTLLIRWPEDRYTNELSLARSELLSGHSQAAYDRLINAFDNGGSKSIPGEALPVLEEAAYQVARGGLESSNFAYAKGTVDTISRITRTTARLENLRLQAERHIPSEDSLDTAGSLVHYGYGLNGTFHGKALPIFDGRTNRLLLLSEELVAAHPGDHMLHVNRGHLLLETSNAKAAIDEFRKASALAPDSSSAALGLDLAYFQSGQTQLALAQFDRAYELAPTSVDILINRAVALEVLDRPDEATAIWSDVINRTDDLRLKDLLRQRLGGLP